jgi:hypothetical protein
MIDPFTDLRDLARRGDAAYELHQEVRYLRSLGFSLRVITQIAQMVPAAVSGKA